MLLFRPFPVYRPLRVRAILALRLLLAVCVVIQAADTANAVLISTEDGTENTAAPAADPGFAHVGIVNGLSGVYVRNGWVLTADHVGEGTITLDGIPFEPVPGSAVTIRNADGSRADLLAFKLLERPDLPDLLLADDAPSANTLLTLVGRGRNRGEPTTWMGREGWSWGDGYEIRWGTNRIDDIDRFSLGTHTFWTHFDERRVQPGGQAEADLVFGDSGGGAFTGSGTSAELIGILMARAEYEEQPEETSFYGNAGIIADLFRYREDLIALIDQPGCADGLDDDGDGLTDYPADPGCSSPSDPLERDDGLVCDNGQDDDGDGLHDQHDPGCSIPEDGDERGSSFECDNGIDDDDDELFDFPEDPGCLHPTNLIEAPEPGFVGLLSIGLLGLVRLRGCDHTPPQVN